MSGHPFIPLIADQACVAEVPLFASASCRRDRTDQTILRRAIQPPSADESACTRNGSQSTDTLPPPNSRNRSYRLCTLFSGRVLSACLMRATFHAIVTSWNCRSMPFFGQSISRLLGPALSGFLILVLYHLGRHGFLYRVRDHPFHHSRTVFKD